MCQQVLELPHFTQHHLHLGRQTRFIVLHQPLSWFACGWVVIIRVSATSPTFVVKQNVFTYICVDMIRVYSIHSGLFVHDPCTLVHVATLAQEKRLAEQKCWTVGINQPEGLENSEERETRLVRQRLIINVMLRNSVANGECAPACMTRSNNPCWATAREELLKLHTKTHRLPHKRPDSILHSWENSDSTASAQQISHYRHLRGQC